MFVDRSHSFIQSFIQLHAPFRFSKSLVTQTGIVFVRRGANLFRTVLNARIFAYGNCMCCGRQRGLAGCPADLGRRLAPCWLTMTSRRAAYVSPQINPEKRRSKRRRSQPDFKEKRPQYAASFFFIQILLIFIQSCLSIVTGYRRSQPSWLLCLCLVWHRSAGLFPDASATSAVSCWPIASRHDPWRSATCP